MDKANSQLDYHSYMEVIKSSTYYKCHDAYKLFLYSQKRLLNNKVIILDDEYTRILNLPIKNKEELLQHMYNYSHH